MSDIQMTPTSQGETAKQSRPLFPRILCAVNGTRGSVEAVRQAAALAGSEGHLTLLAVSAIVGSGRYRMAALSSSHAKRILDRAEEIASEAGVVCSRIIDPGAPPSKVILSCASEHDLLAIGAPVSSWLGDVLRGGVAYSVLRECTIPVLMARRTHDRDAFAREILVASDGSEGSERLVEIAGRLAVSRGGNAMMVHALGGGSRMRPRSIEAQAQLLNRICGAEEAVQIEPTDAHTLILESAQRKGVSLVVIGSRRRAGLSALGSVSRRVVHKASCSVLVVPPEYLGG